MRLISMINNVLQGEQYDGIGEHVIKISDLTFSLIRDIETV
jgi:hypothetical protein